MRQPTPKYAVKPLLEAARIVEGDFVEDESLPTDIRDDALAVVKELRLLADWHRRALAEAQKHSCDDSWMRLYRAMMALAEGDEDAYQIIVSELGDCHKCWNNLLRLAIARFTSDSVLSVGGKDKLADGLAEELQRLVMG